MKNRTIGKITTSPLHQGFLGKGHTASAVIDGNSFSETDPFILLMDDQLNLPGGPPVGGPHPHAGFETVTLVVQGDGKYWKTGSLELMTAGSGIVHTEEITTKTSVRILQLWLVLPPDKRWSEPFFQELQLESVPTLTTDRSEIRVYSGTSNGLTSPLQSYTRFSLVDFKLKDHGEASQYLPGTYNGFIYVIEGSVWIGDTKVEKGQTGWFEKSGNLDESAVVFDTKENGVRFVLYAGEPHHAPVVSHGPFIGDSQEDIRRLYYEYRQGKMPHLNDLSDNRKIRHTIPSVP